MCPYSNGTENYRFCILRAQGLGSANASSKAFLESTWGFCAAPVCWGGVVWRSSDGAVARHGGAGRRARVREAPADEGAGRGHGGQIEPESRDFGSALRKGIPGITAGDAARTLHCGGLGKKKLPGGPCWSAR